MQKTNFVFKKICICLIAVIMCLLPILLAGCSYTGGSLGSGGGSDSGSGGSGSGGSQGEGNGSGSGLGGDSGTEIEGVDLLGNYKITYRPSDDDDISEFMLDIKKQTNEVAFDIMRSLYAQYGFALNSTSLAGNNLSVDTITIDANGNYVEQAVAVENDAILSQTNPLFSSDISIISPVDMQTELYKYQLDSVYSKYFNHAKAIFEDYNLDDVELSWNWNGGQSGSSVDFKVGFNQFVNNLEYRKKLELALILISIGYEITPTGANYKAYTDGAELIESLRLQYTDNIAFYNACDSFVFEKYCKLVDHSGFTNAEINHISNFIQEEIIGTNLVAIDNTRYLNVVAYQGGSDNNFRPLENFSNEEWYSKYNKFLTEESLASFYYQGDINDVSSRTFYTSYDEEDEAALQYKQINDIVDIMQQFLVLQAQSFTKGEKNYFTQSGQLNLDGELAQYNNQVALQLFNKLIDVSQDEIVVADKWDASAYATSNDGVYTADFWDIDGDGDTQNAICESTRIDTLYLFSIRKQYFKNYTNTSYKIAKQITKAVADQNYKEKYLESTNEEFKFDIKYPIISASFYADYNNDEILINENGVMNMTTGYRRYQNVVVMPQQTFYLNEFCLFVTRQPDNTGITQDFEVTMYIRYYDSATNSYATWTQNGAQSEFYDCGTIKVNPVTQIYDIDEPFYVDSQTILSSAIINGASKGNSLIYGFSDLPASNSATPTLIGKSNDGAKYYNFVDLPNGKKAISYTQSTLAPEQRTSYLEILFSTGNENRFQFCLMPTDVAEFNQ